MHILRLIAISAIFILTMSSHSIGEDQLNKDDPSSQFYKDENDIPQHGHSNICKKAPLQKKDKLAQPKATTYNLLAHGLLKDESIENGFIVSLEKFYSPKGQRYTSPEASYISKFSEKSDGNINVARVRNKWLHRAFNDPKLQIVSHIYEYNKARPKDEKSCALYSTYEASRPQLCELSNASKKIHEQTFENGIEALNNVFADRLAKRLSTGQYSHIIVMAMGWNNDQRASICRYKEIVSKTKEAMGSARFDPLVVGFTWPSVWYSNSRSRFLKTIGHLGSIFNKATDSDEIGYLHGNLLLNRVIPLANSGNIPVVAIGHSLGARLIGRSVFSKKLLLSPVSDGSPDLAILLQPALSVYRFTVGHGLEGHPFAPTKDIKTKVVVTTSIHDKANPWALWTKYIGSGRNLKIIRKYDDVFNISAEDFDQSAPPTDKDVSKVEVIDGKKFIFDHNDILSKNMGELIAGLIRKHASSKKTQ